jgi:hypothetical protein
LAASVRRASLFCSPAPDELRFQAPAHKRAVIYHALFGVKFPAMGVFFLFALAGSAALQRIRARPF